MIHYWKLSKTPLPSMLYSVLDFLWGNTQFSLFTFNEVNQSRAIIPTLSMNIKLTQNTAQLFFLAPSCIVYSVMLSIIFKWMLFSGAWFWSFFMFTITENFKCNLGWRSVQETSNISQIFQALSEFSCHLCRLWYSFIHSVNTY